KFYTHGATTAIQQRVRLHPAVTAIAVTGDGRFDTMRTLAPPVGRGYEFLTGTGWDFAAELAELPDLLAAKLQAPSVEPGHYDLVIDPSNLWLTIHESIGHATELDRALGYEAAYAGTSFATFDKLGSLKYGSPVMNVTGDRTVEHGLATIGYDDEGVQTQTWDIVRDGVLVGFQLARRPAARRRLPGHHDRLLGLDGGGRRPADLGAGRCVQLWQGPAGADRSGQPRLPIGVVPRREHPQRGQGGRPMRPPASGGDRR